MSSPLVSKAAIPRLRADVSIRPFECSAGSPRFVVAVDGRHFVVTEAVAATLEATRSQTTLPDVTDHLRTSFGASISEAQVLELLRERIPRVVFEPGDGQVQSPLGWRLRLLPGEALVPLLKLIAHLLSLRVAIPLMLLHVGITALAIAWAWKEGLNVLVSGSPATAAIVVIAGMLVHELGHLSACRRFGAPHGGIGVGLYWFVPAFYAEVSGAWLLPRLQRAVVDAAGIYLQCVFLLGVALFALCRGSATALLALWYSHFLILNTLNPVLKYDGYWLLSDLTGSHNLHRRVRENARLCWRVLNRERDVSLPCLRELGLLVGFGALTALYFSYTLHLIGRHLAHAAHAVMIAWSQYDSPGWILVGRAFGFLLLVIMAFGVAMLLARAVREIVGSAPERKGGPHAGALEP